MPELGLLRFFPARARYRTLIASVLCLACATVLAAQDVGVDDPTARMEAVSTAVRARDPKAAVAMVAGYQDEKSPAVRAALVRGVAVLDPVRGGVLAQTASSDLQPSVRLAAAEALAKSQGTASVPALVAALNAETNAGVRHTIIFWLGTFKTAAARAALAQALGTDSDPNVRLQAARSLQRHGTKAARAALAAGKNDSDSRVRSIADEP